MVLREAVSAFCKKRRLPLSSTMQMVTSTLSFLASASAAATMVLMAARLMYFLLGRSAETAVATKPSMTIAIFNIGGSHFPEFLERYLGNFRPSGCDFDMQLLFAEFGMCGCQRHGSRLFLGADPDGASAADQGKRIVPNDFAWAIQVEPDGVVGKRADPVELIGDTQHDPRRICAVGNELGVIG